MPDTYTSQFSGEEIDSALRAAQMISGASTPAELRKKLKIRGDTIPVSAADPTPVSEALTASGGGVNPNLLDNWYFGRPVNQRGQTEYTENGYIIDRWKSGAKKVIVANKYITLQSNGTYHQILQPFELQLAGKIVTMSALINTHSGHNVGMLLYDYANEKSYSPDFIVDTTANQWMVVSTSFRVADNAPDKLNLIFYPDRTEAGDQTVDILAAKLELGDTQTLAHKENGVWVLNEIPDYGEQLRRCQRFCRPIPHKLDVCVVGETYYAYTEESFEEMRVAPVLLTNLVGKNVKNITDIDATTIIAVFTWNKYGGVAIQLSQNPNTDIVFLDSMNYLISADL